MLLHLDTISRFQANTRGEYDNDYITEADKMKYMYMFHCIGKIFATSHKSMVLIYGA